MTTTRRQFLASALAGPALITLAGRAPGFLLQAAEANRSERILVVVQLSGGNDGLNTVVPYADETYQKLRPKLAVKPDAALKIAGGLGFHPVLRGFSDLLEQQRFAIVQGVGYPTPNRSHFESMDIWHTCQRKTDSRNLGWLGRYLDALPPAPDVSALHLGREKQPLALAARRTRVPSVHSLEQFKLLLSGGETAESIKQLSQTARGEEDDLLSFVQTSTSSAIDTSQRLVAAVKDKPGSVTYPQTGLAQKLQTVAQMISSGLRTRVYYVEMDGFDTHSQQPGAHEGLLRELGDAVKSFSDDLVSRKLDQQVLLASFSEFGRRVAENASEGTDHGAAAPLFLCGPQVKPGLIGAHPSLTDLEEGDLKFHTDFRRVYATLVEDWLGGDSALVLDGKYSKLGLLKS